MASLFDDPFEFEDDAPSQHVRQSAIPNPPQPAIPLTVSELTADIRAVLESGIGQVWVEGELSNCKLWQTGHLYFTLKDTGAQIRGVMFRSAVRLLKFKPLDGQHVVISGRVSVYDQKGEYQVVCESMEPRGLGALQLAFEQLKKKLAAAGLFDQARKRPLPLLPRKIGVVTSLDGAAFRDILSVLGKRYPQAHVVIRPARVQGEGAAGDIAHGLRMIAAVDGIDVLLIGLSDLTADMGIAGQIAHPRVVDAIETVSTACRSAGRCSASVASMTPRMPGATSGWGPASCCPATITSTCSPARGPDRRSCAPPFEKASADRLSPLTQRPFGFSGPGHSGSCPFHGPAPRRRIMAVRHGSATMDTAWGTKNSASPRMSRIME